MLCGVFGLLCTWSWGGGNTLLGNSFSSFFCVCSFHGNHNELILMCLLCSWIVESLIWVVNWGWYFFKFASWDRYTVSHYPSIQSFHGSFSLSPALSFLLEMRSRANHLRNCYHSGNFLVELDNEKDPILLWVEKYPDMLLAKRILPELIWSGIFSWRRWSADHKPKWATGGYVSPNMNLTEQQAIMFV